MAVAIKRIAESAEYEQTLVLLRFCVELLEQGGAERLTELGVRLREAGHQNLADQAFQVAVLHRTERAHALFELSVSAWLRASPYEAVGLIERMQRDYVLDPYQNREFAHRLMLVHQYERADRHLQASLKGDPSAEFEVQMYREFMDFWRTYPLNSALERCHGLAEIFPLKGTDDMEAEIATALASGQPYSVLRLNDGEGALLDLGSDDEARYARLYRRMRGEFHRTFWFGDESMIDHPAWLSAVREFNAAVRNADCLAAYQPWGLEVAYQYGSVRNVPAVYNVVRKLHQLAADPGLDSGQVTLCASHINQDLSASGGLERLLASQRRIGLVSCYDALPNALKSRFGVEEVLFHRTAGEASIAGSRTRWFQEWHERVSDQVKNAEPGTLYLVAAGIVGKVYCDQIKRAGGVALDIGSIADIWMRTRTRPGYETRASEALV